MTSAGGMGRSPAEQAARMDGIYRRQRHIYDATRKYYLLGRDRLIRDLDVPPGARVLELGCGTGRNLALIRRQYPECRLFGLDISEEMLISARRRMAFRGSATATLTQGDASALDARRQFGEDGFERIVISYALSMIPPWRETLAAAAANLVEGGRLLVVDFGDQERLPAWFRSGLRAWLARFDVTPRPDLDAVAARLAARLDMDCSFETLCRGYAQLVTISNRRRPGRHSETADFGIYG